MHNGNSLRPTRRSTRANLRRLTAAVLGAVALTGGLATSVSAIDAQPAGISGDPHSPTVAHLAAVALQAKDDLERGATTDADAAYGAALVDLATATAHEMGISATDLVQAWQRADRPHQTAVLTALTQLGVPYRRNTSEPFVGFDCSGLTSFAWREAGVELSRQSGSQISEADERTAETAMAGDLVQYPGHVMLYLGVSGAVVHASNPEHDVELWLLSDRSVNWGDPSGLAPIAEPAADVASAAEAQVAEVPEAGQTGSLAASGLPAT